MEKINLNLKGNNVHPQLWSKSEIFGRTPSICLYKFARVIGEPRNDILSDLCSHCVFYLDSNMFSYSSSSSPVTRNLKLVLSNSPCSAALVSLLQNIRFPSS